MRLFFALWPDEAAASKLAEASKALAALTGGKPVAQDKIHLTLAFLGDLEEERLDRARRAADGLRHEAFDLVLDEWGSFRGARVAWAGCTRAPEALVRLQAYLAGRVREAGFELEERAFSPHVTLARKIVRAIARRKAEPVGWRAREVALVRSQLGKGSYENLRTWVLGN
jgi:2'-5' RNA ligase